MEILRNRYETLSPRQREVALLLAEGLTNSEIALRLNMTVHTAKAHRAEVMRRMGAQNFADLVDQIHRLQLTRQLPEPAASRFRIIVVEDDGWYRDYLTENLVERGFEVVGVADGTEFDAAWKARPANLVILDIELGANKESGIAIATRLLKSSVCGVIMVTARGEPEDRLAGLSIGVDAYLSKPVNINELALTITNLKRRLQ